MSKQSTMTDKTTTIHGHYTGQTVLASTWPLRTGRFSWSKVLLATCPSSLSSRRQLAHLYETADANVLKSTVVLPMLSPYYSMNL